MATTTRTRNKLGDLHDHLFAQIERLSEDDIDEETLDREVKRSSAMVAVSAQIIGANRLGLDARKAAALHGWPATSTRRGSLPSRTEPMAPPRGHRPWNKGTRGLMQPNAGSFRRGHRSWNAGTKGQGLTGRNRGSFGGPINPGGSPIAPVGTRRWERKGQEWLVKVPEPSPYAGRYPNGATGRHGSWRPARVVNWEREHGPVPPGLIVWRLLPICDCPENLVLVCRAVAATLNRGHWTHPPRPWRSLPLDHESRYTAVLAAVTAYLARERARSLTRPCLACGAPIKARDRYGRERFYCRGHNARTGAAP